jgi:hypothetical protein
MIEILLVAVLMLTIALPSQIVVLILMSFVLLFELFVEIVIEVHTSCYCWVLFHD